MIRLPRNLDTSQEVEDDAPESVTILSEDEAERLIEMLDAPPRPIAVLSELLRQD